MPLKIVLTGAPGTGKSTIINLLLSKGFFCMEEISREIIKKAEKEGKKNLFLSDPILFSDAILNKRIEQFEKCNTQNTSICFFDRGIPDVTAYLNHVKTPYPEEYHKVLQKHTYDVIFIFPPWKEIYTNDSERFESYEEAIKIDKSIVKEYQDKHPKIINVPIGTPQERLAFILNKCHAIQPCGS
ncbi:ATP-binding protein [Wenyingzhuangia sp. 1_MG-2023]|nr:ATP-binding protein [Wenyingzhuangia sp. 1_MG-2023]